MPKKVNGKGRPKADDGKVTLDEARRALLKVLPRHKLARMNNSIDDPAKEF